jgi:hypothetical protein
MMQARGGTRARSGKGTFFRTHLHGGHARVWSRAEILHMHGDDPAEEQNQPLSKSVSMWQRAANEIVLEIREIRRKEIAFFKEMVQVILNQGRHVAAQKRELAASEPSWFEMRCLICEPQRMAQCRHTSRITLARQHH